MYTMPESLRQLGVRSLLSAVAVASVLRGASGELATRTAPLAPRSSTASPESLPMAEIQFTQAPRSVAAESAPALAGEPVPSRWSQSDRPIGWEAMGASAHAATLEARGEPSDREARAARSARELDARASASTLAIAERPAW